MPLLQNHILDSISTLINQSKKWVEFCLAIIQPIFKSLYYFFTQNMLTLHKITEFKSSRVVDRRITRSKLDDVWSGIAIGSSMGG